MASLTVRQFISVLIDEAIAGVEHHGFVLSEYDKRSTIKALVTQFGRIRKKSALDEFTVKEDPKVIIEEALKQIVESRRFAVSVPFVKEEHFNGAKALSLIGVIVSSHIVHGILNGDFDEFSPILGDIEQILGYVEMRRLQAKSALRDEDLQKLSAALTKTLIDVESYFANVKEKKETYGQYL